VTRPFTVVAVIVLPADASFGTSPDTVPFTVEACTA
jgi:hypothetical protein